MRRELAVWVTAVRSQVDALVDGVRGVCWASRDENHLLHGLIDPVRLSDVYVTLESVFGDLASLDPCDLPDVLEVAQGYQTHWLTPQATKTG